MFIADPFQKLFLVIAAVLSSKKAMVVAIVVVYP